MKMKKKHTTCQKRKKQNQLSLNQGNISEIVMKFSITKLTMNLKKTKQNQERNGQPKIVPQNKQTKKMRRLLLRN
jgi:hypothetical protein